MSMLSFTMTSAIATGNGELTVQITHFHCQQKKLPSEAFYHVCSPGYSVILWKQIKLFKKVQVTGRTVLTKNKTMWPRKLARAGHSSSDHAWLKEGSRRLWWLQGSPYKELSRINTCLHPPPPPPMPHPIILCTHSKRGGSVQRHHGRIYTSITVKQKTLYALADSSILGWNQYSLPQAHITHTPKKSHAYISPLSGGLHQVDLRRALTWFKDVSTRPFFCLFASQRQERIRLVCVRFSRERVVVAVTGLGSSRLTRSSSFGHVEQMHLRRLDIDICCWFRTYRFETCRFGHEGSGFLVDWDKNLMKLH